MTKEVNLRVQIQIGKLFKAEPRLTMDLVQLMAAANDFITIIEANDLIQHRDVAPQDAFFEAHGLYFFRLCLGHLNEIMRTLTKLGTEYPHIVAKGPPELLMLYDRISTTTVPYKKMISRLRNKSIFHYDQLEIARVLKQKGEDWRGDVLLRGKQKDSRFIIADKIVFSSVYKAFNLPDETEEERGKAIIPVIDELFPLIVDINNYVLNLLFTLREAYPQIIELLQE